MCGIIGIISSKEVSSRIVNSLKKLEYRGYDSAGIATLVNGNINGDSICQGDSNLDGLLTILDILNFINDILNWYNLKTNWVKNSLYFIFVNFYVKFSLLTTGAQWEA